MPNATLTRRTLLRTGGLAATALSLPFVRGARAAAGGVVPGNIHRRQSCPDVLGRIVEFRFITDTPASPGNVNQIIDNGDGGGVAMHVVRRRDIGPGTLIGMIDEHTFRGAREGV